MRLTLDVQPFDVGFPHNMIGPRPNSNNGVAGGIVAGQLGYIDYVMDPKPIGQLDDALGVLA
jgi:hypothetical protein